MSFPSTFNWPLPPISYMHIKIKKNNYRNLFDQIEHVFFFNSKSTRFFNYSTFMIRTTPKYFYLIKQLWAGSKGWRHANRWEQKCFWTGKLFWIREGDFKLRNTVINQNNYCNKKLLFWADYAKFVKQKC